MILLTKLVEIYFRASHWWILNFNHPERIQFIKILPGLSCLQVLLDFQYHPRGQSKDISKDSSFRHVILPLRDAFLHRPARNPIYSGYPDCLTVRTWCQSTRTRASWRWPPSYWSRRKSCVDTQPWRSGTRSSWWRTQWGPWWTGASRGSGEGARRWGNSCTGPVPWARSEARCTGRRPWRVPGWSG